MNNITETPAYQAQLEISHKYATDTDITAALATIDTIILEALTKHSAGVQGPRLKEIVTQYDDRPTVKADLKAYIIHITDIWKDAITAELQRKHRR